MKARYSPIPTDEPNGESEIVITNLEGMTETKPVESRLQKVGRYVLQDILAFDPYAKWYTSACQVGFSLWAAKEAFDELEDYTASFLPQKVIVPLCYLTSVVIFISTQQIGSTLDLSLAKRELEEKYTDLKKELDELRSEIREKKRNDMNSEPEKRVGASNVI
ncbi:hypothetical protein [Aquicella lusitana]|uniref:Uncharacterized protein n=1 Tax=Aquicella lusitana TaxID=254246 RepID=A0A370G408_9COXI|nr:hypothetical protein [Aquicella lusitana]RDI37579.1 hypothetical protein C8D86_1371 [Aquicella lusitana]VVC73910.1 hypothetical protein AQULUS_16650 [Aquicella lusitana]